MKRNKASASVDGEDFLLKS